MLMAPDAQRLIDALEERAEALERENKILREELALLKQHLFGRRSERLEPGQAGLFGLGDLREAAEETARSQERSRSSSPKPKGHGRKAFPEHLPRETVQLTVPQEQRICPDCGQSMRSIGYDVTERGHFVPARFVVRRYEREKVACAAGHAVVTAQAPEGLVPRAKYEASAYAHAVSSKYLDHLPLNRLEGIFKRQGTELAKQTMWDMLVTVDEQMAQPVLEHCRLELLREGVLLSDESPVRMRLEEGRGSKETWVWLWRSLREGGPQKVLVDFKLQRNRDGPKSFLGDWKGTLICDGTSAQDGVVEANGIVRAGCWAHARRYFKKAFDTGTKEAALCLAPIGRLFWLERAVNRRADRLELDLAARRELRARVRAQRSAVVHAKLYEVAGKLDQAAATLARGQLGKGLSYLARQRGPLAVFLTEPRIPIHNNDSERDLRHIVVGRNNWQVFASPKGGEVACRLYSLVLSAKLNGVDPREYIEDVLGRLSTTPHSRIAELTPWGWAAARRAEREAQAN
jgi:transposase